VVKSEGKAKIVRRKWSFLEAIHECNIAKERVFPNRFYDTLLFLFLNAQTNRQITSHEGMLDAPEIIMKLDGIYPIEVGNREKGFFQKVADTSTVVHTRPG
jgi:hypothetical protein